MNGTRTVVEMLRHYGTEVIFGVPGDTRPLVIEMTHSNDAFKHNGPVFIDVVAISEVAEFPPGFSWQTASDKKGFNPLCAD